MTNRFMAAVLVQIYVCHTGLLVGGDGSSQTHSRRASPGGGDRPGRRVEDVTQQLGLCYRWITW